MRKVSLFLGALTTLAGFTAATHSQAGDPVHVLVLKEQGIGSAAQAQPHVDQLIEIAAEKNGWAQASGKYITRRKRAKKYIAAKAPKFGMVSLGAFLGLRASTGMEAIGSVSVARGGGEQYFVVGKSGSDLSACRGKKLASNHAGDTKFVDQVVANGAFKLADFELMKTRRPVQTIKKVIKDKAACALIDDSQKAELAHIQGGSELRTLWSSSKLPPMVVVAFSGATGAERAKFSQTLGSLCGGTGKSYCDKVGIRTLKATSSSTYKGVIAQYDR